MKESNPRPAGYKAAALPTELMVHLWCVGTRPPRRHRTNGQCFGLCPPALSQGGETRGRKDKARSGATRESRTRTSSLEDCDAAITSVLRICRVCSRHGGFSAFPLAGAFYRPAHVRPARARGTTRYLRWVQRWDSNPRLAAYEAALVPLQSLCRISAVCPAVKRLFRFAKERRYQ